VSPFCGLEENQCQTHDNLENYSLIFSDDVSKNNQTESYNKEKQKFTHLQKLIRCSEQAPIVLIFYTKYQTF